MFFACCSTKGWYLQCFPAVPQKHTAYISTNVHKTIFFQELDFATNQTLSYGETLEWWFSYTVRWSEYYTGKHCGVHVLRVPRKGKNRKQTDTNSLWTRACFLTMKNWCAIWRLYNFKEKKWNLRSRYEQAIFQTVRDRANKLIPKTNSDMVECSNVNTASCKHPAVASAYNVLLTSQRISAYRCTGRWCTKLQATVVSDQCFKNQCRSYPYQPSKRDCSCQWYGPVYRSYWRYAHLPLYRRSSGLSLPFPSAFFLSLCTMGLWGCRACVWLSVACMRRHSSTLATLERPRAGGFHIQL